MNGTKKKKIKGWPNSQNFAFCTYDLYFQNSVTQITGFILVCKVCS